MATLLWQRGISSDLSGDASSVKNTFSSWDKCMTEAYCKYATSGKSTVYALLTFCQMASNNRHHNRIPHRPLCSLLCGQDNLLRRRVLFLLPILLLMLHLMLSRQWSQQQLSKQSRLLSTANATLSTISICASSNVRSRSHATSALRAI